MACNVTTNELLHRYFSRILIANSIWKLSERLFLRKPFPPRTPQLAASIESSHFELFWKKKVFCDVFFSKALRCSGCSVESADTLAKLWIYFLHQNTWIPWKKNLFLSLLNCPEKRDIPKKTTQRLLLCIIIKVAYPDMERI